MVPVMMVLYGLIYYMENTRYGIYGIYICWCYIWYMGRTPYILCDMVCVDGMAREKYCLWYGTFAVWYHGTVSWMCYMAKFAWWYGMFQYIRSVRVEYVVRISSVTSLYIGNWKVF